MQGPSFIYCNRQARYRQWQFNPIWSMEQVFPAPLQADLASADPAWNSTVPQNKLPTMQEEKFLIVVPRSLQRQFLAIAHDKAGHQGIDRTLAQLSEIAYWVQGCNTLLLLLHEMPAYKIITQSTSTSSPYNCLQTMGVGSRHSKSANVTSGKPVHLSSPRLSLKVAICSGNAWSESREDSQDFTWSSIYTGRTPRKTTLWPR